MADIKTATTTDKATYERANRVAITVDGDVFKADFYRTHKHVCSIKSNETKWTAPEGSNKSTQREDFRRFITHNAADIGVEWKPEDMRGADNKRTPKYPTVEDLISDSINLISDDITEFNNKCPYETAVQDIKADNVTAMDKSPKGTDLSKLGITGGHYNGNGNWAWATISICVTLKVSGQEIYVSMDAQLVSGQLKKPTCIDGGGYTQTAWNTAVKTELINAGIIPADVDEPKQATKKTTKKATDKQDAPKPTDKPKRKRKVKKTTENQPKA